MTDPDFLVIGAGIAGVSVACELARVARVRVLEQESQIGYHATGRSAALYAPAFGNETVRRLTRASGAFFRKPPSGFADYPLIRPRGTLFIASSAQRATLAATLAAFLSHGIRAERVNSRFARERVPALRADYLAEALYETESHDVDVDLLLQGYARGLTSRGGEIVRATAVSSLRFDGGLWHATTDSGEHAAPVVINAAGAWAEQIAAFAGVAPLGLVPLRRTAFTFAPIPHTDVSEWPAVADADEQFYFKPEAGKLLASPADETPSVPCDAAPEEWDVALAVDRVQHATDLTIARVEHRWAGLRTFAADRSPVIGYDTDRPGFFWLAGQGGYGVQTAPAAARAAAALAARQAWPDDLTESQLSPDAISPARLRHRRSA